MSVANFLTNNNKSYQNLNINDVCCNSISFSNSNDALNFYGEILLSPTWSANDGSTANGQMRINRIGNLCNFRISSFQVAAGTGTPNQYIVSQTSFFPNDFKPITGGEFTNVVFIEGATKTTGRLEYDVTNNELRIYKDDQNTAITNSALVSLNQPIFGSYVMN